MSICARKRPCNHLLLPDAASTLRHVIVAVIGRPRCCSRCVMHSDPLAPNASINLCYRLRNVHMSSLVEHSVAVTCHATGLAESQSANIGQQTDLEADAGKDGCKNGHGDCAPAKPEAPRQPRPSPMDGNIWRDFIDRTSESNITSSSRQPTTVW